MIGAPPRRRLVTKPADIGVLIADRSLAVLLSGMGSDGAEGMAEMRRANVLTIAQERRSCAVFGMPRAALEHQGVALSLAPPKIGRLLARARSGGR